jgi:iron only hydrogenase large subunit-like protein
MREFKGSKGKWEKYITKKKDIVVKIGVNKQLTLGHIYDDDCDIPSCCKTEEHANALLISKAPEMLEMLKSIISDFEGDYVVDEVIVDQPYKWLIDRYKEAKQLIKEATEL